MKTPPKKKIMKNQKIYRKLKKFDVNSTKKFQDWLLLIHFFQPITRESFQNAAFLLADPDLDPDLDLQFDLRREEEEGRSDKQE